MLIINFSPFPALETERLVLRAVAIEDAGTLFAMRSNPQLMKYIGKTPMKHPAEGEALAKRMIDGTAANEGIDWAIVLKSSGAMIGTIAFWRIVKEHFRGEIGYMLMAEHQGKGLMSEAMSAVLHYGFETLQLHSVEANLSPGNSDSEKILQRHGFVKEGLLRESFYFNGAFEDTLVYGLVRAPKQ